MEKGYEVHGIKRRASSFNTTRIDHLYQDRHENDVNFFLHYGDMIDPTNLIRIIQDVQPDIAEVRRDVLCQNEGFRVSQYYE